MKVYGYYDVYIIDSITGQVMYSAAKESDYGTNLKVGKLKDSALAEVFNKTLKNRATTFSDMKPYGPSNNMPTMFIGKPISYLGEITTVLIFQISDRSINNIMQFRHGYGDSQEDYLVGPDNLMRSDSYLSPEEYSLKASFKNKKEVKTKASLNALKGNANTEIVIDYRGNSVLSAYSPVKIGNDFTWAIISQIDEAEVVLTPNSIRNTIIIISIVLVIAMILILIFLLNKTLIQELRIF